MIFLSCFLSFLFTFCISSAGGSDSGVIHSDRRSLRILWLFLLWSSMIPDSVWRFFSVILWLVRAVAKSFALSVTVGRWSARGFLLSHIPNRCFISSVVYPPKNAVSPLLLIRANPWLSIPRSYKSHEKTFSVSVRLSRACMRSISL